jgi:UPF0716 protein FxsA
LGLDTGKTLMLRSSLGLILVALPFLELALLVKTGQVAGFWATLAMVVAAGLAGAFVLSRQSLGALRRAMQAIEEGRPPVPEVLDGGLLMMAGLLLITPGFITDAIGLLLLIAPLRRALGRSIARRALERSGSRGEDRQGSGRTSPLDDGKGPVIEGEFERLDEKPSDPRPPSP